MKLPGVERAEIEPTKLRQYLLPDTHPIGRFKSVFFNSLGYSSEDWQSLESDLRELAASEDASLSEKSE